jgi:hypothetical protein
VVGFDDYEGILGSREVGFDDYEAAWAVREGLAHITPIVYAMLLNSKEGE